MNQVNPKVKKIIIAIIFLFVLSVGYFIYEQTIFHETGTYPSLSQISELTPYLQVNFNYNLRNNGLNIASINSIISSYKVTKNYITINFNQNLKINKQYTLVIKNIQDTSGDKISQIKLSFKVIFSDSLPAKQQKLVLNQQQQGYNKIAKYKILPYLPFYGPGNSFQITYNESTVDSTGKVQIFVTAQGQVYEQSALSYLESLPGYNASQYQIVYVNQQ